MNTSLETSIGCCACRKTVPIRIRDASLVRASSLADVVELLEGVLSSIGWTYGAAEVETNNGGLRLLAVVWCPNCGRAFGEHLGAA